MCCSICDIYTMLMRVAMTGCKVCNEQLLRNATQQHHRCQQLLGTSDMTKCFHYKDGHVMIYSKLFHKRFDSNYTHSYNSGLKYLKSICKTLMVRSQILNYVLNWISCRASHQCIAIQQGLTAAATALEYNY